MTTLKILTQYASKTEFGNDAIVIVVGEETDTLLDLNTINLYRISVPMNKNFVEMTKLHKRDGEFIDYTTKEITNPKGDIDKSIIEMIVTKLGQGNFVLPGLLLQSDVWHDFIDSLNV